MLSMFSKYKDTIILQIPESEKHYQISLAKNELKGVEHIFLLKWQGLLDPLTYCGGSTHRLEETIPCTGVFTRLQRLIEVFFAAGILWHSFRLATVRLRIL